MCCGRCTPLPTDREKNNKNVQCPRRQPPPPTDGNEPLDVNNCSTSV